MQCDKKVVLLSGFYLEILLWRGSERVEDDFITIYADAFNQPLPLAETFLGAGGGELKHLGKKLPPASPSR